ncbi:MAG: phosphoglycerate dehydrogenase [Clostridia bacterium]
MAEKILITPRSYGKTDPSLFEKLTQAGYELVLNDSGSILDKAQMAARIAPCVGVIVGVDPMDADVIAAAPQLRAIAKYGVGVDNIDLDACKARGIKVSRTVGANAEAVADYAMALMLSIARGVLVIDQKCRAGDWRKMSTHDVSGQTLGLFGLGAIGKLVAQRAQGFGMTVLAYDVYWDAAYASSHDIAYAKPDDILTQADFISLHLPLLPDTQGFIGARELSLMKKDAILINTARGGLIDEDALLDALKAGRIGGAGLDAFATEPPKEDWFHLGNVVLGAHCAASTPGATQKMGTMATENLLRDLA